MLHARTGCAGGCWHWQYTSRLEAQTRNPTLFDDICRLPVLGLGFCVGVFCYRMGQSCTNSSSASCVAARPILSQCGCTAANSGCSNTPVLTFDMEM